MLLQRVRAGGDVELLTVARPGRVALEALEGRLLMSLSAVLSPADWLAARYDQGQSALPAAIPLSADTTPPAMTAVYVNGTTWSAGFRGSLQAQGMGDATFGYAIPAGSGAQLNDLPWSNVNQLSVRFSENVVVDRGDLVLTGVNVADYSADISAGVFSYDSASHTATWTLDRNLLLDKFMLTLNAYGTSPITDAAGNCLDGEWTNPKTTAGTGSSSFPSGDGVARGNFAFRLNIAPGDANQDGKVSFADYINLANNFGQTGANWAGGDFNGDGAVTFSDYITLANSFGQSAPAVEPVSRPAGVYAVTSGPVTQNGITTYVLASDYQLAPVNVYVLLPSNYDSAKHYKVLYVLPAWSPSNDGIVQAQKENLANKYDVICVGPDFASIPGYPSQGPWYGDNPDNPKIRNDSYLPDVIVPFIDKTYSTVGSADGRMLIGFSKSGVGAVSELLRHPDVFGRAGSWDGLLMMDYRDPEVYGSSANFYANYYIPNLLSQDAAALAGQPARIAISGYGFGNTTPAHNLMAQLGIPHYYDPTATGTHAWTSGWLGPMVNILMSGDMTAQPPIGPLPG